MNIIAILQARMSSKRYPGKVLHKINNKCLLQYILERLKRVSQLTQVIVATSTDASDDPINIFCNDFDIECYRGSLENVVDRFQSLLGEYPCDAFLRVNGDSPFIDNRLIETGIKIFCRENYDLVTNVLTRTFPKGQSVEIVKTKTFKKIDQNILSIDEKEHITKYFYNLQSLYSIHNFTYEKKLGNIQLSVDTAEDMNITKKIFYNMTKQHWQYCWHEIYEMYTKVK